MNAESSSSWRAGAGCISSGGSSQSRVEPSMSVMTKVTEPSDMSIRLRLIEHAHGAIVEDDALHFHQPVIRPACYNPDSVRPLPRLHEPGMAVRVGAVQALRMARR